MRQTKLDEYASKKKKFVCKRCGQVFDSVRGLNIHISKIHAGDELPPTYMGEGIKDIKREGQYVVLKIRIKRSLWHDVEKAAFSERITPEEAIIASLVNLTVCGARVDKPIYIT